MKETFVNKYGPRFEEKFVICLLQDKEFAEQCVDAFDQDFIDADYLKEIVVILLAYYGKYKTFPSITNLEMLVSQIKEESIKKLCTELIVKAKVESDYDLEYVKDESIEFLKNKAMVNAVMHSVDLIQQEQYDQIKKVIDVALRTCASRDLGHDYFESLDDRTELSVRKPIPTGWDEIDKRLSAHTDKLGGLSAGEMGVFIAPTGTGKSMALVNVGAAALRQGKTVVHYTLELKDVDVGLRYDACLTGYPIGKIRVYKDEVNEKLKEYDNCKLIIKEYPTKSAGTFSLERHLEQLRRMRIFPDLIVIDYADLLKMENLDSTYSSQANNYEQLRRLAGEWQIPIWTASQGNRGAVGAKIVDITHIAESYGKACVADVILSISRTNNDKVLDSGRVFLLKNRVGPDGLIFPASMDFSNATIKVDEPIPSNEIERLDYKETKSSTADLWKRLKSELVE